MHYFFAFIAVFYMVGFAAPASAQDLDITEIVAAQADYDEAQTEARRAALLTALKNYQGDATVETVNAHLIVMSQDTVSGTFAEIRESAMAAIEHLEPVQDIVPRQYIDSKFVAAMALFNGEKDPDAMLEMAHVQGFANQFRNSEGEQPEWATDLKWKAEAWTMAMDAFFESERDRHPDDDALDAILATYPVAESAAASATEDASADAGLPFCDGRIVQNPKMRYPSEAQDDGLVGAVIIGFDLNADGQVINPKVLASIPNDAFEDRILSTLSKWRYRATKRKQIGVTCELSRSNIVMPFTFLLQ